MTLDGLTEQWLRGVVAAGFVPGVRARARAALRDLLEEFVAAVRAEPFDAAPGARIGAELVDLRMSAPPVIGATVHLIAGRLPAVVGEDDETRRRILDLLDRLVTGFVAAQRDAAVRAAEEMNRSEKIHWRAVQLDLQRQLQQAVLHRPDTGLPNEQHLRRTLAEIDRGQRLGLLLISLDRYDELSDTLGPDNGARLLTAIARRLRPLGVLAHLADDQFAVLVTGTTGPDDLIKVADQAVRLLAGPVPIDGHDLHVTPVIGLVERPVAGSEPDRWLHDARLALRWARQDRLGPELFDPARAAEERRRHRLAAAMPAALDRGEFTLHYQPLVRLADGATIGVEALARWPRPGGRPLDPQQFIQVAERTGLIHRLGRTLLEQACRQGAEWRRAGHDLLVSVNLSPVQLSDPGLVAAVADILHRSGLPADRLQLEITETGEALPYRSVLAGLGGLGVRLALDDFGTGYSSLAVLTALPFTEAKLAAELLLGFHESGVLGLIIAACHEMGMTVTAEGIETAEQEQTLRALGCDHGQGYHLGRPAPAGKGRFCSGGDG
ncbi:bifunctional diguanylate cyclase/phosphodiesterase [Actinoplanes sp. LDG1-06]|uniref:Bifunctional diguanylate cyclase/phosphodiesterase n=1 Tax=Paractinoplanes ovalisporus TaxID=2810368 RepID=A0ABS2A9Z6_9ACTN|nr:bifunctional diguanylate cyclase/phosphodiesterase [Actinoplanes ovalisporus]MBM2616666.1 bifunctional diguanylate cyclase/phosphodiesterase [Actinoplanes ovalisporus]